MINSYHKVIVLLLLFFTLNNLFAQSVNNADNDERVTVADNYFNNGEYGKALKIYLELQSLQNNNPSLNYHIGLCYFYSDNHKLDAISHLEYVLKHDKREETSSDVYYYLARSYHFQKQFNKAIEYFNLYKEKTKSKKDLKPDTNRLIQVAKNGITLTERPVNDVKVKILNFPINTSYDDFAPIIANAGKSMYFTSNRPSETVNLILNHDVVFMSDAEKSDQYNMLRSYRKGVDWDYPVTEKIPSNYIKTHSISNDGKNLILSVGKDVKEQNFYISKPRSGSWTPPKRLSKKINSKYNEKGACFAAGGHVIYFASDRPGGYGGFDIYKTELNSRGNWTEPKNLGPVVNSEYDEVNPFVPANNKELYFSSNGFNSMGGLDIFKSDLVNSKWTAPKNLGYPINSTYDDDYFVQINDGVYSFFSSNRNEINANGGYDILSIFKAPKEPVLSVVHGVMKAFKNSKKIPITLEVHDFFSKKEMKTVYSPDPETGNYFMLLPPGGKYVISAIIDENTTKESIVTISEETVSYELNQTFNISPIKLLNTKIGELVKITDADYRIKKRKDVNPAVDSDIRYDPLVTLMAEIIIRMDNEQLNHINDLEKVPEVYLPPDAKAFYEPLYQQVEDAFDKDNLEDLSKAETPWSDLQSAPLFYDKSGKLLTAKSQKMIFGYTFHYAEGEYQLKDFQIEDLDKVISLLKEYDFLNVDLIWYPYSEDDIGQDGNKTPEMRIKTITDYLKNNGISTDRFKKVNANETSSAPRPQDNLLKIDLRVYQKAITNN